MPYYHAAYHKYPSKNGLSIIEPKGYYEDFQYHPMKNPVGWNGRISKGWEELPTSKTKETSFAKTVGGAVLGFASGNPYLGPSTFYLYETDENPDFDLTRWSGPWTDFHILGEVRYRRPVVARFIGVAHLSREDKENISDIYNSYPNERLALRRELDGRFG